MKLVRIIKLCLTELYSIVQVGKNLSDMFPIRNGLKQGDALSPLLFNFALEYAFRRVQINQDGLKLNGTHQLLIYADGVYVVGGSVHTIKKNTDFVVASKEIGLAANAEKIKCMSMYGEQNAGQKDDIKIDNSSFEKAEQFRHLGTTLTNQTSTRI